METNFLSHIDCLLEGQTHEWSDRIEHGDFYSFGWGTMKYRECLKCIQIEYSFFTGDDGKTIDIDAVYRSRT